MPPRPHQKHRPRHCRRPCQVHHGKPAVHASWRNCLVVEAMRDLVSDDDADAAVVERLGEVLAVEVRLQDSSGEN